MNPLPVSSVVAFPWNTSRVGTELLMLLSHDPKRAEFRGALWVPAVNCVPAGERLNTLNSGNAPAEGRVRPMTWGVE